MGCDVADNASDHDVNADIPNSELTMRQAYDAVYDYLDDSLGMNTVYKYHGYLVYSDNTDEEYVFFFRSYTSAHARYYVNAFTGDVYGNYIEAGKTANLILRSEKEDQGIIYHLTLYLQIFILYYAFQEKPPETVQKFMQETAESCRKWFLENGFEVSEMDRALKIMIG